MQLVALEEGISPRSVLRGTGLDMGALTTQGNAVDLSLIMRTYERVAELSTQPGIGFRSPNVNLGDQGLLGAAMLMAGTVDDALSNLQEYGELLNIIVRYEVRRDDGRYVVRTTPKLRPSLLGYRLMTEENLAIWKCASVPLANLESHLEELWIDYPAPDYSYMYHALFPDTRLVFDQPYFQAVLRGDVGSLVLPASNPTAVKEVEQLCAQVIERMTPSTSNRVRAYLLETDPDHWTVLRIAYELGTTEKTLRRRLSAEGTTAKGLIAEHQYVQATEGLGRTNPLMSLRRAPPIPALVHLERHSNAGGVLSVKQYQLTIR